MAARFVHVDHDTPLLLPPDLRDWISKDHMVYFIMDAVATLDLTTAKINERGTGSAQYPPATMLALLIYCYATGSFSSRRIETLAIDDAEKTLAWSAEVSVDYERVSARVVFAEMMERDQVSALAWSRDLPPERAHLYPYLMGVVNLDFTEEQFSEGTKEMSVEDRAEFRRLLEATAR